METSALSVTVLLVLLATTLEAMAFSPVISENSAQDSLREDVSIFREGSLDTKPTRVDPQTQSLSSPPPVPLYVVSPTAPGHYPILIFVHGTVIGHSDYSDLFEHVASHGFIVISPLLWKTILWFIPFIPSHCDEIHDTARVASWLPSNLQEVLPEGVKGDISKLVVSGHSRGGKTAIALGLAHALEECHADVQVKISGIVGLDPVAGTSKFLRTNPHILDYRPNYSFDTSVPTMIIGTGLGNVSASDVFKFYDWGGCARNKVSHAEFYAQCRENCAHFVVMDYGHLDMLDGNANAIKLLLENLVCRSGEGPRDLMKKTVGGLFVAYLKAVLLGEPGDYNMIIDNPSLAPARLAKPELKSAMKGGRYAQK